MSADRAPSVSDVQARHYAACDRQFDHIGRTLDDVEARLIDPIEFGEIKGQVSALSQQIVELRARQAEISSKLDEVLKQLTEARGAWRGISWVIGVAAAALGAIASWFFKHMTER